MGRSTRWLLSLIGLKKSSKSTSDKKADEARKSKESKRRWSFGKASAADNTVLDFRKISGEQDQTKHALAIAAASAAAAEAAVAAAQAAAAVVRLTGGGNYGHPVFELISREEWAAIKIQTAFRGYLARRALRALKAVVRIQALFRGHRVRKQAAITLRCMQALVRVQARVRARRVRMSEEGQAVQQQLWERRQQQQGRSRKSVDGWNASTGTVEDLEAKNERKHLGAMKRERALSYALSQLQSQQVEPSTASLWSSLLTTKLANCFQRTAPPMVIDCEPDTPHWGWSWLERWMAARPWENPFEGAETSPVSGCTKIVEVDPAGKQTSMNPKNNSNNNVHHQRNKPVKKRSGSASDAIQTAGDHPPNPVNNSNSNNNNNNNNNVNASIKLAATSPPSSSYAPTLQNSAANPALEHQVSHPSPAAVFNDSTTESSRDVVLTKDLIAEEDSMWAARNMLGLKPLKNVVEEDTGIHLKDEDLLSSFPNYMATTQSSKAKVRSHSTPKQRPELPDTPRKRNSMNALAGSLESRSVSSGGILRSSQRSMQQRGFSGSVILDRSLISLKDGSLNGDLRKPFRF